jgi:hypothetical protein
MVPGGTKEKRLIGVVEHDRVRFQGELVGPRAVILDRTTLVAESDGRVHQQIEISRDGGRNWLMTFDAWYSRADSAGKTP